MKRMTLQNLKVIDAIMDNIIKHYIKEYHSKKWLVQMYYENTLDFKIDLKQEYLRVKYELEQETC
jgi:hypothetical protein